MGRNTFSGDTSYSSLGQSELFTHVTAAALYFVLSLMEKEYITVRFFILIDGENTLLEK